jgi:hypothetical protein
MSTNAATPVEVDTDEGQGQPPVAWQRFGAITVSIWERRTNDGSRIWFEYTLRRSYRDDADTWHNTYSFRADDTADIEMATRWAHRWLRTEGKTRSQEFARQQSPSEVSDDIPF